jgi:hypothetical protein
VHRHVDVSNRLRGCHKRFNDAHASGDIPNELFRSWEKKRTQAKTASAKQRANGKKTEFVREQLALERKMDMLIGHACGERIERNTESLLEDTAEMKPQLTDTNVRVQRLESMVNDLHSLHMIGVVDTGATPTADLVAQSEASVASQKLLNKAAKATIKAEKAADAAAKAEAKAAAKAAAKSKGARCKIHVVGGTDAD